jgi:low molecular weight protein-tyrosine phosphatase
MASELDPTFNVLFVCTGNLCRSATAEGFARREMQRHTGTPLRFISAGTHAVEGSPAASRSMTAAAERGAGLERHHARELTKRRVRASHLILCMAAEHRPYVLALDRSAVRRTFLIASFARAVSQWSWLANSPAELVAMAAEHVREQPGDDIADPLGHPPEAYAACAERLDGLVTTVVDALVKSVSSAA